MRCCGSGIIFFCFGSGSDFNGSFDSGSGSCMIFFIINSLSVSA
jgi:hypothetical protein